MEFLRFGSSIPGEYWGCCCGDIIQNFKQDPDTPASIQLVHGDGGSGMMERNELAFLGPTLRDIFWQRLRLSTFGKEDMPNHFFLAVLEDSQLRSTVGSKWLAILKEAGFEYLRCIDNSVYTGPTLVNAGQSGAHKNHMFGLFRGIGSGNPTDPFTPPREWTELPKVIPEVIDFVPQKERKKLADEQRNAHTRIWNEHGPTKILTESEVVAAGAPVIMAGIRSEFPPQLKAKREEKMAKRKEGSLTYQPSSGIQYLYDENN